MLFSVIIIIMLSLLFYLLYKGCKITREGLSLDDYENIKSKINTLKTTIENLFKGIKYNDPLGDPTNEDDDGQVTTIYNAIVALTFSNIENDDLKTIGNYLNEFQKEIQKCILFINNKNQSGNDLHKSIITENNLISIKDYLENNTIKLIGDKRSEVIEKMSEFCTGGQQCINKKFECIEINSDGTDFCGKNDDGTGRELSELNCKKCNSNSPQGASCLECQDGYCLGEGDTCMEYDGKQNICNSGSGVCAEINEPPCRECATKTSDLIGSAVTCLKCGKGNVKNL